jgi:hypothetical protein
MKSEDATIKPDDCVRPEHMALPMLPGQTKAGCYIPAWPQWAFNSSGEIVVFDDPAHAVFTGHELENK